VAVFFESLLADGDEVRCEEAPNAGMIAEHTRHLTCSEDPRMRFKRIETPIMRFGARRGADVVSDTARGSIRNEGADRYTGGK